jgi:hypothetical protein
MRITAAGENVDRQAVAAACGSWNPDSGIDPSAVPWQALTEVRSRDLMGLDGSVLPPNLLKR